nr:hypothetical protein [uncultured Desulfobulbus sp.]
MKIVMFQYNRESSAIIQQSELSRKKDSRALTQNSILANGYNDRFLWEETQPRKPKPKSEYIIPGNWQ